ncbi:DMSO/TMAO reductase YedYZ molybdopterin-dependent catalytic subunit [Geodermatophilus tzadiensis]|uniref:DMSO/TMAO reductase YedYZ molybdopterin-dependent catalytic subunit n=1 Tax=Geodermatophilus tzadiensis TaxID=1137988 RepID=A0A2T0SWF5_9ACTN|nr:molybdopterin-dependent oxidoreductase [Geodermatophilus tzadiensis]PRY37754.1 DMSO/TMAO reductase YedYZ molybdopterin-dependent catalytic subunit [Geodermatophilus tzadiensis]
MTTTEQAATPATGPDGAPTPSGRRRRRLLAGLAGLPAAAVALGAAELAAGLVGPSSSPVVAVGGTVITLVPEPVKQFAIATFGEHDKTALVVGTLVLVALYAVVLGRVALRSRRAGVAGTAAFGLVGALAAVTRPAGGPLDALPSVAGAVVGVVALLALVAPLTVPAPARHAAPPGDGGAARRHADEVVLDRLRGALGTADRKGAGMDRRRFFVTGGAVLGAAAVSGGAGRLLQRRFDVSGARGDLTLPPPSSPAPALPAGADLAERVPGLTPLFTANRDFYRVDTALTVPQIRPSEYSLTLRGMFDAPCRYTLPDLFDRDDVIERDITLTCVSNEVGGTLASTARWTGVPLGALLRENGIQAGSDQLVCRSQDGMTIGASTRAALEVEDAMIAFGQNGEPLPVEHGFPVRMLIPGLYGYVSACKWLTEIEASTYDAFDVYWTQRDWARQAPVKLFSRIDTPVPLRRFPAGRTAIAGVAWAQTRGIARVEVRIDDGEWREAQLSPRVDADLWRQWVLPHDFAPGAYQLTVRATAADGEVQTEERAAPFPDGASGLQSIRVIAT